MIMRENEQKSIVGTRWKRNEVRKPYSEELPKDFPDVKDYVVKIYHESPFCVSIRGCNGTYTLGRCAFFDNFTLIGECPKDGFKTSIGTMLIKGVQ